MADNVEYQSAIVATPPSGTDVATDEIQVGGTHPLAHVQFMKLVDGTLNGTDPIRGDSANGLDVDVTRLPSGTVAGSSSLPAGTNNIGDVDVLSLPSLPAGANNIGDVDVAPSTGAARTSVADNNADTQLLASNASRKMAIIVNDSDQDLYVGLGAAAVSTTDYTYFLPRTSGGQKSQLELPLPVFSGEIRGIWSANSTGSARITELT